MTLTEFLLARIAEDEYEANVCLDQYRRGDGGSTPRWVRQLAECEAKRRIIAELEEVQPAWDDLAAGYSPEDWLAKRVALALALPYADHPDYDEAWRPGVS